MSDDTEVIDGAPMPALGALPDDPGIALERYKGLAHKGPILKLVDRHVISGLAAGAAAEQRPRNVDHVRPALALVEQRRAAPRTEAADGPRMSVLKPSDASLALHHARVLAPGADICGIGGAMRAAARCGVIVPGPKSGEVYLQLHRTAETAARDATAG